ncbi:MAG: hypothetical protein ACOC1O_02065 [bacterium]
MIREMFTEMINKGYKKGQICSVTLGDNFNPQFKNFIEGTDLGLGPLKRMIENLGYELHLTPVGNDDQDFHNQIQERVNNFVKQSNNDLVEFLNNKKSNIGKVSQSFEKEIEELMNEIE